MKKLTRYLTVIMALFMTMMCITACGTSSSSGGSSSGSKGSKGKSLDFSRIEWSVDDGIVDGERYTLLSYTNNSSYTVCYLNITFAEKGTVTQEDRDAYVEDIAANYITYMDEDEIEELKQEKLSAWGESEIVVAPGESESTGRMYYYGGSFYMRTVEHYTNYVEPDIAEIHYVKDDQIITAYYDFHSGKLTEESETQPAYYWTTGALKDAVPQPEVSIVEESWIDSDTDFECTAKGMDQAAFESYKAACIAAGYNVDAFDYDNEYMADNADGFSISLWYYPESQKLDITVRNNN